MSMKSISYAGVSADVYVPAVAVSLMRLKQDPYNWFTLHHVLLL